MIQNQIQLDEKRTEADGILQDLIEKGEEYEQMLDESEDAQAELMAEIAKKEKELSKAQYQEKLAQEAAKGKNSKSNPGGYIWPVDSRYITSTVGGRTSPGGVGSTNHKGTDIGRVGYTSPIYASKAGTVIVSTYSRSYGNYVVVSHGTGNTTLYAHLSKRSVKVGDTVAQGTVLGVTGSTGNSTGPHLHFEITEGGNRVDPLKYLTGYIKGWS